MRKGLLFIILTAALAALCFASCSDSGNAGKHGAMGKAQVEFSFKSDDSEQPRIKPMLAFASDIAYIRLTVNPANVNQVVYGSVPDGDVETDEVEDGAQLFSTTVNLPIGVQTFTATAYNGANAQIGVGTANATVLSEQTIAVHIVILDTTGPANPIKHAPIISSITASKADPIQDESITLTVAAVDPDNDTLTYQWSSNCGGTFTASTSATTDWSAATPATCVISIVVSDASLSDTATINIRVYSNRGDATVDGRFASHVYINRVTLTSDDAADCAINAPFPDQRENRDGSCQQHFTAGRTYYVEAAATFYPDSPISWSISDTCNGYFYEDSSTATTKKWQYTPRQTGVCKVTVGISQAALGFSDSFIAAFLSSGCATNSDCGDYCLGSGMGTNGSCGAGNVCQYSGGLSCEGIHGTGFTCFKGPARCSKSCNASSDCTDYCLSPNTQNFGGICTDNVCNWSGSRSCTGMYGAGWVCPTGYAACTRSCTTGTDCPAWCDGSYRLADGSCDSNHWCAWSLVQNCEGIYGSGWFCPIGTSECAKGCTIDDNCTNYCSDSATLRHGGTCGANNRCTWGSSTDCYGLGQVCRNGGCENL